MTNFIQTLDKLNFFHHVNAEYPLRTVKEHQSNLFASIFEHDRAYLVAKVLDTQPLEAIETANLNIYRMKSALLLGVATTSVEGHSVMTCFPLNPNTLRSQFYPTEDESLEVEVHFVNKLDGKLIKVLRLLAKDVGFTHELVAQFKDSAQTSRNSELFYQHVRLFFAEHDKDECLITKSTAIILKQHSDNDEPELNAIMTIVDEALSLTEDEMNRLEEIAASQN